MRSTFDTSEAYIPFTKRNAKNLFILPFWCQQRQEERRLLNACQTCTYGRTQKTPLAGKSQSQFPVASAAAPRVSNGCIWSTSRFCHGACRRRGTWAWHRQREGASQRDRSEDIWTKKEKMHGTNTTGHNFDNGSLAKNVWTSSSSN